MTQVHFTFESEEIQAIINESGANDTAKTLMTIMFNQLMEEQRNQYIQANAYERSEERQSQRNGYYDRSFTTRIGTLELHVPRTRDGKFSPTIFERYQRSEKALIAAMIEMVISGVSTRKVTKTVELLTDGATVSKSFVSNLMKQLDPFVFEWRNRSLEGSEYPFFMCDALYMKVRENHRIVSKGVYIGIGIDSDGRRTILGFDVQDGESEDNWDTVFQSFVQRGLFGVKLVISDAHKGLVKAVRKKSSGGNDSVILTVPEGYRTPISFEKVSSDVKDELKSIFKASELELTRERKEHFLEKYGCDSKLSAACDILENGFEDAIQILSFPENIRRRIRTTNVLERLNEEIRRRERVIRIFPNINSITRIIGTLLMEKDTEWLASPRKYLEFNSNNI
ncbi:IS256 family transposase [Enterococcus faecium]|nr:IS256 family transposase [Enterococcus faecium]